MAEGSSAFRVRPLNQPSATSERELPATGASGSILSKNGQDAKDVAWITKTALAAAIAADVAFSTVYQPIVTADGSISTRTAGVAGQVTRATLAADTAFSTVYAPLNGPAQVTFTVVRRGGGTADTLGTGGGAIASGLYQITEGKCFFSIKYTFGAAGAVANGGVTTFDAPVNFGTGNETFQPVGSGVGIQAGARFTFQVIRDGANNGFQLYSPAQVTSAVPGAVTFNDFWWFNGWYWV